MHIAQEEGTQDLPSRQSAVRTIDQPIEKLITALLNFVYAMGSQHIKMTYKGLSSSIH